MGLAVTTLLLSLKSLRIKPTSLLQSFYNKYFSSNKETYRKLDNLLGFTPSNLSVYDLAFRHVSASDSAAKSNERLEYLGDALLDSVVAEYLFKKFPLRGEGFLTETRAKIVSRKKLGSLARKLQLQEYMEYNQKNVIINDNLLGNSLEALVGAIYLDKGYQSVCGFIINKLLKIHIDLDELVKSDINYKSRLLEWCQKNNRQVEFHLDDEKTLRNNNKLFVISLHLDGEHVSKGTGGTKKTAEKKACAKAFEKLSLPLPV